MPKQLQLSAIIELPDDVFEAAAVTAKAGEPWAKLLSDLKQAGVKHTHASETVDAKAKVERAKRGSKTNGPAATSAQAAKPPADTASLV